MSPENSKSESRAGPVWASFCEVVDLLAAGSLLGVDMEKEKEIWGN